MNECQALILLSLARESRPLQVWELAEKTGEVRQNIYRAVTAMDGKMVRVERPRATKTIVHLRAEGIETLKEILTVRKR